MYTVGFIGANCTAAEVQPQLRGRTSRTPQLFPPRHRWSRYAPFPASRNRHIEQGRRQRRLWVDEECFVVDGAEQVKIARRQAGGISCRLRLDDHHDLELRVRLPERD